jgi:phosphotransferase system HPr (HPr) family protein
MIEDTIKIVNRLGLHARAAAQLVKLAGTFRSKIVLKRVDNGYSADAKSILNLLTLAASDGTELTVTADGPDESEAFEAVVNLIANRFGESM